MANRMYIIIQKDYGYHVEQVGIIIHYPNNGMMKVG